MTKSPLSAVLAGLLLLNACTSWQVQPVSPTRLVDEQRPSQVRLHGADGKWTVLGHPFVRGDSLLGLTRRDTAGVALNDVHAIEIKRFDWLKTTGLAVLTLGVVAIAVGYVVASNSEFGVWDH